MLLVTWPCEIAHILLNLYIQSDSNSLGFTYPIKLNWWVYLSCTVPVILGDLLCYIVTLAKCSMLSAIVSCTLFGSCFLICIYPLTNWFNLNIAAIGLSQIDIGRLGKHGFELLWLASQIGDIRQCRWWLSCTSCAYRSHCLCSLLLVKHSNSDKLSNKLSPVSRCNCATTHIHLSKFKQETNILILWTE